MKLLSFQASRFAWKGFETNLPPSGEPAGAPDGAAAAVEREVRDAVVVFLHAEAADEEPERRKSTFKKALKHVKWLANKRELKNVVLHSFAHLGGENAAPEFTRAFLDELDERLSSTGYRVERTPFGWFCTWELAVFGESLAKVWKEF